MTPNPISIEKKIDEVIKNLLSQAIQSEGFTVPPNVEISKAKTELTQLIDSIVEEVIGEDEPRFSNGRSSRAVRNQLKASQRQKYQDIKDRRD